MNTRKTLTHAELTMLDAMITAAEEKGLRLGDHVQDDDNWIKTTPMMMDKAGGKFHISNEDLDTLKKIDELAAKVKFKPTLQELIELRKHALPPKQ